MGLMKELFMAEQEKMAEKYLEEHPDATEEEAWDYVNGEDRCDQALTRAAETMYDSADNARRAARDDA